MIVGVPLLRTMSALATVRQPRTGRTWLASPSCSGTPRSMPACDMNVTRVAAAAMPSAPNIGR